VLNTILLLLIKRADCLALGMPNKRHPTRKFIGFWATSFLKEALKKHAVKKRMTLSVLIAKILWDFVNSSGAEILLTSATQLFDIC